MVKSLEDKLSDNEYIGIHCTHGVNRTGYMIVYYLCYVKNLTLENAIDTFNRSRTPHTITKEFLL